MQHILECKVILCILISVLLSLVSMLSVTAIGNKPYWNKIIGYT